MPHVYVFYVNILDINIHSIQIAWQSGKTTPTCIYEGFKYFLGRRDLR